MISICVPAYEMNGKGCQYLQDLLESIDSQIFREFEVVISDDSEDDAILNFVKNTAYSFPIVYTKNAYKRGASGNMNNAIRQAKFPIIKPLFQDDKFIDERVLQEVFKSGKSWGVFPWVNSTDIHKTYTPRFQSFFLLIGRNMLGCPSGIYFRKHQGLSFDENLVNLMDTDMYYQLYKLYGTPQIHRTLGVEFKVWEGSVSSSIVTKGLMYQELRYTEKKYRKRGLLAIYKSIEMLQSIKKYFGR